MSIYYDNFRNACKLKGTTITAALDAIHRPTSMTGNWSHGTIPKLDVCVELADYLGISLDELVFGKHDDDNSRARLTANEREWLDIASHIPLDKQETCKAFLRTHMAIPEKYVDDKNA